MESTSDYFVFAGGGTGGHLFPALAVVEKLRPANERADVALFCTHKQIDADILGRAGIRAMPLSVRPFPVRPWQWPGFYLRWRESVRTCMEHFHQRRPAAVIGAGGYASGPPVHAALRLGIPTFILNPDAVPGRANRYMARRKGVSGIFAQWDVTRGYFPPDAPVIVSGCPVRASFLQTLEAFTPSRPPLAPPRHGESATCQGGEAVVALPCPSTEGTVASDYLRGQPARSKGDQLAHVFGLDANRRTILVTGASQGARTINEAILRLAPIVTSAGWQVLHVAGVADADRVRQAYAEAKTPAAVLGFTDRMAEAMLLSDLIVSRAGASSLAEILAVGRASILFPYPFHRDQHQKHNGQVLVDAAAAVMIEDSKDAVTNAESLRPVLETLLRDDARREGMSVAARHLGRPDAAVEIAAILLKTSTGTATGVSGRASAAVVRAA